MIKRACLSEFEPGEAVCEVLGAVIAQKNKGCLYNVGVHAAAKKALEWTKWDERHRRAGRKRIIYFLY